MFPKAGSQILTEPGSPEDFHVMEVKNVSRDGLSVTGFGKIASTAGNGVASDRDAGVVSSSRPEAD
jgi:hypothetical protein